VEKTKTLEIKPLTATITPLKVLDEKPTVNTKQVKRSRRCTAQVTD
jgi:hypothetical protein